MIVCSSFAATAGHRSSWKDQRLERLISENAARIGFRPTRRVIEVEGVCARCIATGAD